MIIWIHLLSRQPFWRHANSLPKREVEIKLSLLGNKLTLKRVDVIIDESKLCIYFDVNLFRLLVDVMLVDVKIELTFSNE